MTLFKSVLVIQRTLLQGLATTSCHLITRHATPSRFTVKLASFNPTRVNFYTTMIKQKENTSQQEVDTNANTPSTANVTPTAGKPVSKLIIKQRPPIKKTSKKQQQQQQVESWSQQQQHPTFKVRAYATADYYDLESLRTALESSGAYTILSIDKKMPDSFVCASAKYAEINEVEPRHMFFFLEGTVVFWNLSKEEQTTVLDMLHKYEKNPYPLRFVRDESELMEYSWHHINDDGLAKRPTRLVNSHIYFESGDEPSHHLLEKYAFSDAMSLSVKLGIWEKNLDEFSEHIGRLTDDLKSSHRLKITSEEVLKNLGELLTMRHVVNLDSHFLDCPDFYWDRETLEPLYSQLVAYFTIPKRTRIFNDKLNHCIDLMGILKQHLSDKHHVRLEWIIIWLIFVEVLIGLDVFVFIKKSIVYLFGL